MNQAIAIFHPRQGYSHWLDDLLPTIQTKYPIIITNNDGWQIDALRETFERTNFDEIFFLNETMIVKDNAVWKWIFNPTYWGKTFAFNHRLEMFLGKYVRKFVEQTNFPSPKTRREDIIMGEDEWNKQYIEKCNGKFFLVDGQYQMNDPNPEDPLNFEYRYGRKNLLVKNQYFTKFKSVWNISMVPE